MRPRSFTFGGARGHRFGDSLGVEGAGSLCFRESLVTIWSPFSSRYIATTIEPAWSALGRITDPSGVSTFGAVCEGNLGSSFIKALHQTDQHLLLRVSQPRTPGRSQALRRGLRASASSMHPPAPQDRCGGPQLDRGDGRDLRASRGRATRAARGSRRGSRVQPRPR
jgi:hypothetical protein